MMRSHSVYVWCFAVLAACTLAGPVLDGLDINPHLAIREEAPEQPPKNITYVKFKKLKSMPETIPSGPRGELYKK